MNIAASDNACAVCGRALVSSDVEDEARFLDPYGLVCVRFEGTDSQVCREFDPDYFDTSLPALVGRIYDANAVGCCLHIALDDGNLDDDDVDFCIGVARERGHRLCENAAMQLRAIKEDDRADAARKAGA